jgi:hypothetical protein
MLHPGRFRCRGVSVKKALHASTLARVVGAGVMLSVAEVKAQRVLIAALPDL